MASGADPADPVGSRPLYPDGFNPAGGRLTTGPVRAPTSAFGPGGGRFPGMGGVAGYGGGVPYGPPETAGSFAAVPTEGALGAVFARRQTGPRALPQDLPPQPELFAMVRTWHGGKPVAPEKYGDPPIVLPWLTMEVYDLHSGIVVHRVDYLPPDQDDDALVHEVWERIIRTVRAYDDASAHHFGVRCHFNDQAGHMAEDTWMSGSVIVPKKNGDFGAHTGLQARAALGYGRNHPAPHHAMQEIDMAAMYMHGIDRMFQMYDRAEQRNVDELQRYRDRETQVMELHRDLMKDTVAEKRAEKEFEIKMRALEAGLEKLAPMLSYGGMKLIEIANAKLNQKTARSPREEQSFETMRLVLQSLKASGKASSPAALFATLKEMGLGPDVQEQIMKLLFEVEVDERRRIADACHTRR